MGEEVPSRSGAARNGFAPSGPGGEQSEAQCETEHGPYAAGPEDVAVCEGPAGHQENHRARNDSHPVFREERDGCGHDSDDEGVGPDLRYEEAERKQREGRQQRDVQLCPVRGRRPGQTMRVCGARRSQYKGRDSDERDVSDGQHAVIVGALRHLRRLRKGFVRSCVVPWNAGNRPRSCTTRACPAASRSSGIPGRRAQMPPLLRASGLCWPRLRGPTAPAAARTGIPVADMLEQADPRASA